LISGASERVAELGAALEVAGADAVGVSELDRLPEVAAGARFDAYVQLPVHIEPVGGTVVARLEHFLSQGLLARFRAAVAVLPALGDEARVVLVAGHYPVHASAPDDERARFGLMRVLGDAICADMAPRKAHLRLVGHGAELPELVAAVMNGPTDAAHARSGPVDLSYEDWRTEVLGLVGMDF
jgi:hypothetical protein